MTNAGGPAVLATDAAVGNGALLATLDKQTLETLNASLPKAWSHNNPVDILGDASPETYALTIKELAKDPNVDCLLTILTPQDMTDSDKTAECLVPYAQLKDKPMLSSWMGGETVKKGTEILNAAKIPVFAYPDDAAKTFAKMWQYSQNIKNLYQTPTHFDDLLSSIEENAEGLNQANQIIAKAKLEKRTLLN